ncbi:alpha/beta hydrolase [Paenibacillus senegalimassiliensis]|uniref:alpha/beta hydrolase n=1 Tax=Paenibacillus senegalimassiliensis TaxID=1737426 RepID=UPI00073ECC02|nr:alpha/beta hydrolase [Paenibacillus senegalimassiliensis]
MELQAITELLLNKPTLRNRMTSRIRQAYQYDTAFWRSAAAGPWGAGMFAFILLAWGMPTGFGTAADMLIFMLAGTLGMFLTAHLAALLLALIGLPIPRLFTGMVIFDAVVVFIMFEHNGLSWVAAAVIAAIVTGAGLVVGLAAGTLASGRIRLRYKAVLVVLIVILTLTTAAQSGDLTTPLEQADSLQKKDSHLEQMNSYIPDLSSLTVNPSDPGVYEIAAFTYGSGEDLRRPEFGTEAALLSSTVDASSLIQKWPELRSAYWGFDQHSLPLNGRVWMPKVGEEATASSANSYPLVLIVHGNHLMEDYSDEGYAYLGELLASRGFVAVSVDENFLNYSVWTGIPDNDMKARAWLLLKHLQQIGQFAAEPGTPFYQAIDFSHIGLVGHSRGGQAIAMAADYDNWFADDNELVSDLASYDIVSLAAIAPTDKKVDDKYTRLRDINYLTLQGASDGDVTDFDGDRQYMRTSYSTGAKQFKASLYVADANHSQFNTSWGSRDVSYPKGILLRHDSLLAPAEQRLIAEVYITAFMEETLGSLSRLSATASDSSYLPLFQDYRSGGSWLPNTEYYSRYESGEFTAWARYEEDRERTTLPNGGQAEASGLNWREEDAKNRKKNSKPSRGVVLERHASPGTSSSYTMSWPQGAPTTKLPQWLAFSLTDRSFEMETKDAPDAALASGSLKLDVELVDGNGTAARLPLSTFKDSLPLPVTQFTVHSWLEQHLSSGKYKHSTEAVFQTYRLSLKAFASVVPKFDVSSGIRKLTFHLNGSSGKIMLDDIGVY